MTLPTSTTQLLQDAAELNGKTIAYAKVLALLAQTTVAEVLADPTLHILFNKVDRLYAEAATDANAKLAEVLHEH